MKIRTIDISKKWIPEFNKNKEHPPGEQVTINFLRIPGRSERSNYITYAMDAKNNVEIRYNNPGLVVLIDYIEHFVMETPGKPDKSVLTGIDLAEINHPYLDDLFSEMRDYLFPEEDLTMGESTA